MFFHGALQLHSVTYQCKRAVQEAATICPRPLQVDLWPFDLESGVQVMWRGLPLCQF